jgi:hypothetical protein
VSLAPEDIIHGTEMHLGQGCCIVLQNRRILDSTLPIGQAAVHALRD